MLKDDVAVINQFIFPWTNQDAAAHTMLRGATTGCTFVQDNGKDNVKVVAGI